MNTRNTFWKTIPVRSSVIFMVGVFFIFSVVGCAIDIMDLGRQPPLRYALTVVLSGVFAIIYAGSGLMLRSKFWKALIPVFILQQVVMNLLGHWIPDRSGPAQMSADFLERLHSRMMFDGIATMTAVSIGYACFVYVSISEFRRYFRVHAEMELATEIHHVLVPEIETTIGEFEFNGRSVASGEVGGDLIDVFQDERGWIAYVADVSGHGVAPGVVMGMVKSAARMQISSGEKSSELLARLNRVLLPIKKPDMFATFAYLAWNGERLEYSLAGHPAILHFHAATKEISEETEFSNMPLGMFEQQAFVSGKLEVSKGDIFLLLTDGILEVANTKGEEFGLAGARGVLAAHAEKPLGAIYEAVIAAAKNHGHAVDDQSALIVRRHE